MNARFFRLRSVYSARACALAKRDGGGGVGCTEAVQTREKMGGRRAWDTGTWIKRRRACYTAYDDDDDPIDERTNELKR